MDRRGEIGDLQTRSRISNPRCRTRSRDCEEQMKCGRKRRLCELAGVPRRKAAASPSLPRLKFRGSGFELSPGNRKSLAKAKRARPKIRERGGQSDPGTEGSCSEAGCRCRVDGRDARQQLCPTMAPMGGHRDPNALSKKGGGSAARSERFAQGNDRGGHSHPGREVSPNRKKREGELSARFLKGAPLAATTRATHCRRRLPSDAPRAASILLRKRTYCISFLYTAATWLQPPTASRFALRPLM